MSKLSQGDRRGRFFEVTDRYFEEAGIEDREPLNVAVSGWLPQPNVNVDHHVHEEDRSVSDIPFELANLDYGNPSDAYFSHEDRATGKVYVGDLLDEDRWKGTRHVSERGNESIDVYMIGNMGGHCLPDEQFENFYGADLLIGEILLDRFDVLSEDVSEYCLEESVRACDELYDQVEGVGSYDDQSAFVVAWNESEDDFDPSTSQAETRSPPGEGGAELEKDNRETEGEITDSEKDKQDRKVIAD